MFKDITLGQYYQTESVLHSLDCRTKLVATFVYIIMLFVCKSPLSFLAAALFLVLCVYLSKVPLSFVMRGMKGVMVLLLITVLFNMLLTPGVPVYTMGVVKITKEGIRSAVLLTLRLTMLIMGSSLMTLTTTPNSLTDGLESLLRPLSALKVPVHEVAMMMSIALRFIPILMEETDKITKAQMARGADFESGNFITRAKAMMPILVPLFVSAFKRASDLAMAMEARCYTGGTGRTRLNPLKYTKKDYIAYAALILFVAVVLIIR